MEDGEYVKAWRNYVLKGNVTDANSLLGKLADDLLEMEALQTLDGARPAINNAFQCVKSYLESITIIGGNKRLKEAALEAIDGMSEAQRNC